MPEQQLAQISRHVTGRLNANPRVQKVEGLGADLYIYQEFLTPFECGGLVAMIDADRMPSSLYVVEGADTVGFRTSESCNFDRDHPFVHGIETRIDDLLGMKHRQGEAVQGQRYAVGQLFKAHHDWFHQDQPYWQTERHKGGQRTWTAMVYLDEPEGGGETHFPKAGLTVTPRTGMLVAWNNAREDGRMNPATLHESLPVTAGVKNVITKWYRERFWE